MAITLVNQKRLSNGFRNPFFYSLEFEMIAKRGVRGRLAMVVRLAEWDKRYQPVNCPQSCDLWMAYGSRKLKMEPHLDLWSRRGS